MNLHEVNRGIQKNKKRKRIGRGPGSGQGKTAGKGHKGQKSNAGWSQPAVFQGGTMPLVRRVPKRGFNNRFALTVATLNVSDLDANFDGGAEVSPESLREKGLVKHRYDVLKILGDGELNKKLKVSAHRFSAAARTKIEQAGGEVVALAEKTPVAEKQAAQKQAKQGAKA